MLFLCDFDLNQARCVRTHYYTNILEGIGMKKEGVLRNRMINSKGEKIDKIIYSILKEELEEYA